MKEILFAACCVLITHLLVSVAICQQDKELSGKAISINMSKQPLGTVFRYLMENYDISIGFEESQLDRGLPDFQFQSNLPSSSQQQSTTANGAMRITTSVEKAFRADTYPITIIAKDQPLSEILDEVVRQMGNYRWETHSGVINIIPTKNRDERFAQLLNLKIANFELPANSTSEDIVSKIQSTREFWSFMRQNHLIFTGIRNGPEVLINNQYRKPISQSFKFANVTIRDLLNGITKIKGGGWRLTWLRHSKTSNEEFIDIDI
jgi:hypothetical protein